MTKRQDEAAYLESQADRLEQFVDFGNPRPAVFPKLKPSTARVTFEASGRTHVAASSVGSPVAGTLGRSEAEPR